MNDQENIKRIRSEEKREEEWEFIRKEMEAGSGATQVNVSTVFSDNKASMALILQELRKELDRQRDAVKEFSKPHWDEAEHMVAEGWCEALEFAIKLIDNKGSKADQ